MQSAETPSGSPVVAITGAGRGIGAATAARFANEGWRVAILDSAAATLEDTARTLGTACAWSGVVDVTDYASLAAAATAIGARTQRIDRSSTMRASSTSARSNACRRKSASGKFA